MTDDQKQPVTDAADGIHAPSESIAEVAEQTQAVAVEDMIPEPEASAELVAEELPAEPHAVDAEPVAEPVAEPPADAAEPALEVAALTAADIPALDGCDVEKSWSGDEACEGTEAIAETPEQAEALAAADPEADSGLEAAEGEVEAAELVVAEPDTIHTTPTWPFIAYLVVWALLCVAAGYALLQIPQGQAVATTEPYRIAVLGGVAMTIAGPLLILAVWIASMFRAGERGRTGMLASSLLKGSVVTFLGVIMWWGTFLIVDQVRFGRFF